MTDEFKIRKDILGPIALPLFISWIQDDKGLLMPLARRSFADAVLELIRTSSANKKLLSQDHILLKRLRFSINSCGGEFVGGRMWDI